MLKKFSLRFFPLLVVLAAICLTAVARRPAADTEAAERKAEYIFLEAASLNDSALGNYYMLLRHAQALNPSDPFIAGRVAEIELYLPTIDSARTEEAYDALRRRFEANPLDDKNAMTMAAVARENSRIDDEVNVWETVHSLVPGRNDIKMNLADALAMRYARSRDSLDRVRALALYSDIVRSLGTSANITYKKINLLHRAGDTLGIIAEADSLRRGAPADAGALLLVGSVYEEFLHSDSALVYFDMARDIDPDYGMTYLARAGYFAERGDSAAYDAEIFRALEARNLDFDQKFHLVSDYVVNLYKDSLQWHRIDSVFTVMEELNPGESRLHEFYAGYLNTIGRNEAAAEQMSYAISLDPSNRSRWSNLVDLYTIVGDSLRRDATLSEAMTRFPDAVEFAFLRGQILFTRDSIHEALDVLNSINVDAIPNPVAVSAVYTSRGDMLWKLGMGDSARVAYRAALKANSENYMAMNNLAYFNAVDGVDLDEAEMYAMVACVADSKNPIFLDTYAWVEFKKKDYKKARELIDRALDAYVVIAKDTIMSDEDVVVEDAPDADDVDVPTPTAEIYDHAGDIYFMNGEPDEALEFWKQAAALAPDDEKIKKKILHKTYFFE
ncbi:MAG: tetratricopeptide repeat protein [Muribaculaceae bacterium]|nr:tetratricopeptide repeat protein [Muribaculaceae bacterium]